MDAPSSSVLDFYREESTDNRGRRLSEILGWPDAELEGVHNYIQWLFPLPEPSGANPSAPLLDQQTIGEFRCSTELEARLRESFERMLRFYGLELNDREGAFEVTEASNFPNRAAVWLQAGNHNHLRITRILRCLMLLGLQAEARAFFIWLSSVYEAERGKPRPGIPDSTFRYWRWAMESDACA